MYDNSAIEPYKNRCLDQRLNIEEISVIILYNYINRHAGTPNKTKTEDTISLDYSSNLLHCV